ncbi:hypothetical protein SCHPADRAFT_1002705 [Schizopora paradoxa]|uniref:Uncharacterized protein n=1 Tax=Schizopora paradoxa TaxID=27342 RepID=A0A0H2R363_9AGAM|nr:hypothetical protein SCHPADRAFT_1002705 [Schizopora paradoxa]
MALTKQNACSTRRFHAKTTRISNSVALPPGTFENHRESAWTVLRVYSTVPAGASSIAVVGRGEEKSDGGDEQRKDGEDSGRKGTKEMNARTSGDVGGRASEGATANIGDLKGEEERSSGIGGADSINANEKGIGRWRVSKTCVCACWVFLIRSVEEKQRGEEERFTSVGGGEFVRVSADANVKDASDRMPSGDGDEGGRASGTDADSYLLLSPLQTRHREHQRPTKSTLSPATSAQHLAPSIPPSSTRGEDGLPTTQGSSHSHFDDEAVVSSAFSSLQQGRQRVEDVPSSSLPLTNTSTMPTTSKLTNKLTKSGSGISNSSCSDSGDAKKRSSAHQANFSIENTSTDKERDSEISHSQHRGAHGGEGRVIFPSTPFVPPPFDSVSSTSGKRGGSGDSSSSGGSAIISKERRLGRGGDEMRRALRTSRTTRPSFLRAEQRLSWSSVESGMSTSGISSDSESPSSTLSPSGGGIKTVAAAPTPPARHARRPSDGSNGIEMGGPPVLVVTNTSRRRVGWRR